MAGLSAICDCGREFRTNTASDHGLCPECQRIEDEMYANDGAPVAAESEPQRWSRAAMRERLGITGDVDA